ncbi:hypothetical protein [Oceanobacillus damuensis]|uniref:hypothetical protein n=1 Tax=Oceanobacillus damuensis TaxID=937928 RepID=UPI000832C437|nr:hypothetical protein [Oceanobacillus damuensis]
MKQSTRNIVLGSLLSASGAVLAVSAYRERQKETVEVYEDTDMRNSEKIDRIESVDADKDPSEKGLTQLDHAQKSEWVANGFPQTHQEMKELEEQENKNLH